MASFARLVLLLVLGALPLGAMTPDEIDAHFGPATPVEEALFLRRLSLDLLGTIPSEDERQRAFAGDPAGRRERWIAAALEDPRFAARWARVLRQALLGRIPRRGEAMAVVLDGWLEDRIARGVGLDRIAREILAAEGTPMDNPATAVLLQFENDRADMASHVADVFLGAQLQCARCHDHPFAKWKQQDFLAFTAFFARAREVEIPTPAYEAIRAGQVKTPDDLAGFLPRDQRRAITTGPRADEVRQVLARLNQRREEETSDPLAYRGASTLAEAYEKAGMGAMKRRAEVPALPLLVELGAGETRRTRDDGTEEGPPIEPRFIDGKPVAEPHPSRRLALAARLASSEDPALARAMVNRVWHRMLGRGLVEPVNNVTHPDDASHAALLDLLARSFVKDGHDLRRLVGLVARTRTYQSATAAARPLDPEQIFASIVTATAIDQVLARKEGTDFDAMRRSFENQFVHQFAVDEPAERMTYDGTLAQALFILNGQAFNATVVARPGSTLDRLATLTDNRQRLTRLVHATLTRDPTPAELEKLTEHLRRSTPGAPGDTTSRVQSLGRAYEDVLWSLMTSAEFLTNH